MTVGVARTQTSLDRIRSRFLRRIASDIDAFILPDLSSGDAAERAAFTGLVLSRFAADGDVVPGALADMESDFTAELARCAALLGESGAERSAVESGEAVAAERVFALRAKLADCVRRLSAIGENDPRRLAAQQRLDAIFTLELRWNTAQQEAPSGDGPGQAAAPSVYRRVTPDSVTAYLTPRFPGAMATAVEVLPGGRSKKTIFLSIGGTEGLPASVVMRQDTGMTHIGTVVADEVPILRSLAGGRLPIPEVLHFEAADTALGPPFLLMRRLRGKPTGDFTAFADVSPGFVAETARMLASLHAIDPRAAGLATGEDGATPGERLRRLVEAGWQQWRDHAIEPSPLIDWAFHWALQRCDGLARANAIVHGDYRPHNLLAEDGHLTGVLDWEFAHIGDPAEDLAYFRPTVTPVMPWPDFMKHYQAAGGHACDEETLRFYDVWGVLRLAAMGAGAVRSFLDGATDDFTQGAGGYFVIPMFERRLAELLRPEAPLPGGEA